MLLVAVSILCPVKTRDAAIQPPVRAIHRVFRVFLIRRTRTALVERHHDVRAYLALDIHHAFRRKEQLPSVDMTAKPYALFGHLADIRQAEHLKTAAVRQYRPRPTFKPVQSAGLTKNLRPRPQIEMIGVAQDDLRLDVFLQLLALHTLHRSGCPDRHKYRREDISVVGMYHSRPRPNSLRLAM